MRKLVLAVAAAAIAFPAVPATAFAQKDEGVEQDDSDAPYYEDDGEGPPPGDEADPGDDLPGYSEPPPRAEGEGEDYRGETWRDSDGRLHCRRSDGTTGLIVGGGAGAMVGHGIDRHGERGTGTIIGAIAGAVVGRAIERGARCR